MTKQPLRSRWLLRGLSAALVALAACAISDGGVGGTGIATVRGNVIDPDLVSPALRAAVAGQGLSAAGITVRVRDTAVTDETDEQGFFELSGAIAGEITIEFIRDDHPVAEAERVIVPVDADVTLRDVTLMDTVAAPEQIELNNVIAIVSDPPVCNLDATGSMMLRDDAGLSFVVHINADTVLSDARGPIACADVAPDSQVKFRGFQDGENVDVTDLRVLKRGRSASVP